MGFIIFYRGLLLLLLQKAVTNATTNNPWRAYHSTGNYKSFAQHCFRDNTGRHLSEIQVYIEVWGVR